MPNPVDPLFYLRIACHIAATQADDIHTQNGAVLVTPRGDLISEANCLPAAVKKNDERLQRPLKYSYIEHAERNVIYRAAKLGMPTKHATLYCPWFACAECARAIICAGITEVIGLAHPPAHGAWQESCARGDEMLHEAGVKYSRIEATLGLTVLRDGKPIKV